MAVSREMIEYQRLRELALESELLRRSLRIQCAHVQTPAFWIEQSVSLSALLLGPQNRLGRMLQLVNGFLS